MYLFDLDGTLIDTAPDINAALNHCLATIGLDPVPQSLTRHWVGHGAKVLIEEALAYFDESHDSSALLPGFLTFYEANIAVHSAPYPEVVATLQSLRQTQAKLAVVTNKLTQLTETLLDKIQMREMFDLVVCGDTTPTPKPDPAPVQYCLDHFGVTAGDALYVGDSETDVLAAKAAGVPVICVRDGYNHGIDVATLHPDGIIDTFAELLVRDSSTA